MNKVLRNPSGPVKSVTTVPLVVGPWDHNRVAFATVAALMPALVLSLIERTAGLIPALMLAILVTLTCTFAFARLRRRSLGWHWIATALTFAILIPGTVPLWQQALALSFGVVLGEQIFGGRGRNFLHPTTVALAFLMFSFPGELAAAPGRGLAVAAGIGGFLLLIFRLVSWRVMLGVGLGAAASLVIAGDGSDWNSLITGAVFFATIFLIADPVVAASTSPGRWIYGLLAGILVVVFGQAGGDPGSLRAAIFSALLAGIFAPLIDQSAIWLNMRRRRRRG